jgi:hypothetical protein
MALTISGTSNGKLGNLSLSASTGDILDSANTTFFGVDNWYLTANHTTSNTITSWSRITTINYGRIGTGMSVSSGHWTFPSTGIYLIIGNFALTATASANDNCAILGEVTTDNFSTTDAGRVYTFHYDQSSWAEMSTLYCTFDCTDTSNDKIRFVASSLNSGNYVRGYDSNLMRTSLSFIRLGDT